MRNIRHEIWKRSLNEINLHALQLIHFHQKILTNKIYTSEGKLILSTGAAFFNSYRILHTMKDRNTCKEDKMIKRSLYLHLQLIIMTPK